MRHTNYLIKKMIDDHSLLLLIMVFVGQYLKILQ